MQDMYPFLKLIGVLKQRRRIKLCFLSLFFLFLAFCRNSLLLDIDAISMDLSTFFLRGKKKKQKRKETEVMLLIIKA